MKKIALLLALVIASIWMTPHIKNCLEERLPDEFRLDKIAMDMEGNFPVFDMELVREIAVQPFHYIGHGGQAVAFASEDNQYVIKFLLTRSMHGKKKFPIPKPTHWIPSHREKRAQQRDDRSLRSLQKAMRNYVLAVSKMGDKTGVLALHLSAIDGDLPVLKVLDQDEKEHLIDLNRASFVFQKKATLVADQLRNAVSDEERSHLLSRLGHFFEERAKLGFVDIERSFMIEMNYGFVDGIPIQLDVGNIEYIRELEESPVNEIQRMNDLLTNWAKEKCLPPF